MKKAFNKIAVLCLCAALLFGLASCRVIQPKDFPDVNFVPPFAEVLEETPSHILMEVSVIPMMQLIQFFELAILYSGSQEMSREDTQEDYWSYTGTYGDNRVLRITMRDAGEIVQIFVRFLDELID